MIGIIKFNTLITNKFNRAINIIEKKFGQRKNIITYFVKLSLKFISFRAGLKLRELSANCTSLSDYFDILTSFRYVSLINSKYIIKIQLYQKKKEIIKFIKFYWKQNPKLILEIGTYDGGTLFFLSKFANPKATIMTIDLPFFRIGEGYSPTKIPFYKSFRKGKQKIHFIRQNSQTISTIKRVEKILKGRKLDVLFIDGDHSYEGVKKDFENYSPFVKKGGIIAFHDIIEHPPEKKCEVDRFWNEIKKKHEFKEIISDIHDKWAGIGYLIY